MENNKVKTGLVIMASGLGRRFGGNKLLTELGGKPLIKWIVDASEALFDERVVVTRSREIRALCHEAGVQCVFHDLPNRNDTVRLGLTEIMEKIDYCFFVPGDQPLITKETLIRLINAAGENPQMITRTVHVNPISGAETVGTPTGFPRDFFDELLDLPEKQGGGIIAKKNEIRVQKVLVEEYELLDIDTVDDLDRVKEIVSNQ